jgi:hypothetical protein
MREGDAMKEKAISAGEAAYVLRRALGATRHWDGALEEMRRKEDAAYLGLRLEPFARMRCKGFSRPIYLLRDVAAFILAARELMMPLPNPSAIDAFEIDVDPTLHCPWQARTVAPVLH